MYKVTYLNGHGTEEVAQFEGSWIVEWFEENYPHEITEVTYQNGL